MKIFPPKVSEGERLFRSFSGKSEERVLLWFLQRKKEYVPILDRPNTVLHWKMPDISERGMNLEELHKPYQEYSLHNIEGPLQDDIGYSPLNGEVGKFRAVFRHNPSDYRLEYSPSGDSRYKSRKNITLTKIDDGNFRLPPKFYLVGENKYE